MRKAAIMATSALTACLSVTVAHAQATAANSPVEAPASADQAADDGTIVVTGTRLGGGFNTPTPVTVLSADQLLASAPTSAGEALATLPAFIGSQSSSKLGMATSVFGAAQALLNLRQLGAGRTLVLLNGERLPFTNPNGTVDTNVIPQALLKKVDVVTGGASASYGADAVAGVVNFILDDKFEGAKLDMRIGETRYGDARNAHVTFAAGHAFMDGRLRVQGSVDAFIQSGIGFEPNGRKWFDQSAGFVTLPAGSATTFGIIPDVRFSTVTPGGLVTRVTSNTGAAINVPGLSNMQLAQGGAPVAYNTGSFAGSSFQSGGDGPRAVNALSPEQKRISLFGAASYELNDTTEIYLQTIYSRSYSDAKSVYVVSPGSRGFTIYADNAYLTPALKSLMAANNVASFTIGRLNEDLPALENKNYSTLFRISTGIKGKLGADWSYDVGFAYGRSEQNFGQYLPGIRALYAASDAVVNPANNQIVCRSTLAGLDPGCVPINLLGPNAVSPEGANYIMSWDNGDTVDKQTLITANLRGTLPSFDFGAGPISLATGFSWKVDNARRDVTPLGTTTVSCAGLRRTGCAANDGVYGGYPTYNPGPLAGRIAVTEFYAELGIPVLKDVPMFKSLDLSIAGRLADYSTSGTAYAWKLGANWQVTDDFRIRVTRSQDIRAPNINELFSTVTNVISQTSLLLPSSSAPGPLATSTSSITTGNPSLVPEVAQTLTLGGVYRPSWLPGVQLSVDYYNINLEKAIFSLTNQSIIDNCAAGSQSDCALISVGGTPVTSTAGLNGATAVSILVPPSNIGNIKTSGIDVELAASLHPLGGKLDLRFMGNYVLSYSNSSAVTPNGPIIIDSLGLLTNSLLGIPRWTANLTQNYELPVGTNRSVVFGLEEQLIAGGKYNANYTPAQLSDADNTVPMVTYVNAHLAYKFAAFGGQQELSFNVSNLFNVSPPKLPLATTYQTSTNYFIYDALGQRFTLGLKARW